jgi:Domain of unknown function (DUF5658)
MMKTEFRCPQCGQASGSIEQFSAGRTRCSRCGLVQRIPEAAAAHTVEPGFYQLEPMAVTPGGSPPREPVQRLPVAQRAPTSRLGWLEHIRPWVFETSQVQGIGAWLVILSAADLLMTFTLLRRSDAFFESNPIAQWFYQQWNITGMVFFKFSMIGGVILLSEIIERKRPGWGRFVLLVGCVGAAFAVYQGGRLYLADSVPMTVEMD